MFNWRSCCPPSFLIRKLVASESDFDSIKIGFWEASASSSTKYGTMYFFISSSVMSRCPPVTFTNLTLPASSNVLNPIQSSIYNLVYKYINKIKNHGYALVTCTMYKSLIPYLKCTTHQCMLLYFLQIHKW